MIIFVDKPNQAYIDISLSTGLSILHSKPWRTEIFQILDLRTSAYLQLHNEASGDGMKT
jgi:hypothetical protein